jgi:hypothetical protein
MKNFDLTYVTIDSLSEGVGSSQILPLLERLSLGDLKIKLISFEKSSPPNELTLRLNQHGVQWVPLEFQSQNYTSPIKRLFQLSKNIESTNLIHARSDIPAFASLISEQAPVLWDVRSLWSDQRAFMQESFWKRQYVKSSRIFEWVASKESHAMSTLTESVVPVLEARYRTVPSLRIVVPTSVNLHRFKFSAEMPSKIMGLYSGTYNTFYDLRISKNFTDVLKESINLDMHWARPKESPSKSLGVDESQVFQATQHDMAEIIPRYSFGMSVCKINAGPSLKAAMPTKVAEFLACGRPVVINKGLGDLDKYLREYDAGVILDGSNDDLKEKANSLLSLIADPETPKRCRALAEKYFDLDKGVEKYLQMYQEMSRLT